MYEGCQSRAMWLSASPFCKISVNTWVAAPCGSPHTDSAETNVLETQPGKELPQFSPNMGHETHQYTYSF